MQEAADGFPVLFKNPLSESTLTISDQCLQTISDYWDELEDAPVKHSLSVNGIPAVQFSYTVRRGEFAGQERMIEISINAAESEYCVWATVFPEQYANDRRDIDSIIRSIVFP